MKLNYMLVLAVFGMGCIEAAQKMRKRNHCISKYHQQDEMKIKNNEVNVAGIEQPIIQHSPDLFQDDERPCCNFLHCCAATLSCTPLVIIYGLVTKKFLDQYFFDAK